MQVNAPGCEGREILLDDSRLDSYRTELAPLHPEPRCRIAFAAVHIVLQAEYASTDHSLEQPGSAEEIARFIDWDATRALRVHVDSLGFGIAEAMDTAQRYYLGWESAARLIRECGSLDLTNGFIAGAGVDHLEPPGRSLLSVP